MWGLFLIGEDGDRKILRQDTKACVWPTHKKQEETPEIHMAFRICRLLAFTPNTMHVVFLYLQLMYVGMTFDQRRWRSKNTATRYQGVRMAHSLKPRENTRDTYGVSYLQAFSFYAEYHACSGSVFTAYVCRGDFRSEKMAIEKYCDKIPRGAYGPLIKTKRKHQRYIRRFVFAGF